MPDTTPEGERGVFGGYVFYGDVRPTFDELIRLKNTYHSPDKPSTLVRVSSLCITADIFTDMAVRMPSQAGVYIGSAAELLNTVLEMPESDTDKQKKQAKAAVHSRAQLRLAELPNWLRAAQGEDPQPDYGQLLEAARAVTSSEHQNTRTETTLIEFVPALLGARALEWGYRAGWMGRMSLIREESRVSEPDAGNGNWDVGVLKIPTAAQFIDPAVKLQIKRHDSGGRRNYEKVGVRLVSASQAGFKDAYAIIGGCLAETGSIPKKWKHEVASVVEIEEITGKIKARLEAPLLEAV